VTHYFGLRSHLFNDVKHVLWHPVSFVAVLSRSAAQRVRSVPHFSDPLPPAINASTPAAHPHNQRCFQQLHQLHHFAGAIRVCRWVQCTDWSHAGELQL